MTLTPIPLDQINALANGTLVALMGITFTHVSNAEIIATMSVDARTHQIHGILHGGASAALAETLGSVGGLLCIDRERFRVVGMELNINHIRPVSSGHVTGTAHPLHLGKTTQVWDIRIENEQNQLIAVSRLTLAVVAIKSLSDY